MHYGHFSKDSMEYINFLKLTASTLHKLREFSSNRGVKHKFVEL